tara:strand:+ start:5392 stop:5562 length:171 start_codon:yes stop_codon:yes gene_type:complete
MDFFVWASFLKKQKTALSIISFFRSSKKDAIAIALASCRTIQFNVEKRYKRHTSFC